MSSPAASSPCRARSISVATAGRPRATSTRSCGRPASPSVTSHDRPAGAHRRARRHPVGEPRRGGDHRPRRGAAAGGAVARRSIGSATTSSPARRSAGRMRLIARRPHRHRPGQRATTAPGSTATPSGASVVRHEGRPRRAARPGPHGREPAVDVTYVFYACEEVAAEYNGLRAAVRASAPTSLAGDAAILGEPTDARRRSRVPGHDAHRLVLAGARAHTARPWMGRNAIHRLGRGADRGRGLRGRRPVLDGCEFREALQAVGVEGGVAGNVVPDRAVGHAQPPLRPRPHDRRGGSRTSARCSRPRRSRRRRRVRGRSTSPPAPPPSLDHPLLASLVDVDGLAGAGQARLDRRRPLRRRRHPGHQLRPRRPDARPLAPTNGVDRASLEATRATLASLVGSAP